MKAESPFDCLKPEAIAALAEDITYAKATKPAYKTIPLAITAGVFIALAFVFYITVTTGTGNVAWDAKGDLKAFDFPVYSWHKDGSKSVAEK